MRQFRRRSPLAILRQRRRRAAARCSSAPGPPSRARAAACRCTPPTVPAMIRVLPILNSLIGIPNPIATRPASTRPIPATNSTTIIESTPRPRPKCSPAAVATIPSYCVHRQPPIVDPGSLNRPRPVASVADEIRRHPAPQPDAREHRLPAAGRLLHCIRELRHNSQLLGKGTALYGCRGTRPKAPISWALKGTPGYQ